MQNTGAGGLQFQGPFELQSKYKASLETSVRLFVEMRSIKQASNMAWWFGRGGALGRGHVVLGCGCARLVGERPWLEPLAPQE